MTGRRGGDAHGWANYIRTGRPDLFGADTCGDPDDVYDSAFRRSMRLRAVHRCHLRKLARTQAAEARLGGQDTPW